MDAEFWVLGCNYNLIQANCNYTEITSWSGAALWWQKTGTNLCFKGNLLHQGGI